MLFDMVPEEPEKKKKRQKAVPPPAVSEETKKEPSYIGKWQPAILGKIDGVYQCPNDQCQADAFDILDEFRGEWLVQCVFCAACIRGTVIPGHLKPRGDGFAFNDGRFAGMTVEEAWGEPRGRDYVEWAAKEHSRQAVRDACKRHLDAISAAT